ncbi:hypothetical protein G8A07_02100 [Roseateles sp. DAIF2]|uniref:DUF6506 family protein n=1 Tax=Roseateles sp. DAIF2 TaxID=2714952 RepID=UPI0018A31E79|nr:DUF6506 family protein [Roseateles sp. DAIF2]QPF71837.1 hypothetical protein G8A07_02100 [Roseateles sp. DAIF2]
MTISWAFIFEAPETDPHIDRLVIERGGVRSVVVAVPEPAAAVPAAVPVAVELVEAGAQFIELCGGFEPEWAGQVIAAIGGRVPVGTVGYAGGASIAKLAGVFASSSPEV